MRLLLIAAASLAIVSAGCNKGPDSSELNVSNEFSEGGTTTSGTGDAAAALGSADFANAIAGGGRFEIESAYLAASSATSTDLKALAAMISSDHKKAGEELKAAAASSNPPFTPLASLDAKQKDDLEALRAAGDRFDAVYIAQQVAAHEVAIGILKNYAAGGASPQLKDFATRVLPTVQGHRDKLNALQKR